MILNAEKRSKVRDGYFDTQNLAPIAGIHSGTIECVMGYFVRVRLVFVYSIAIQKKEGCNQMGCKNVRPYISSPQGTIHEYLRLPYLQCGHKFCWLCMDPWENHSQKTGGSFL